MSPKRRTRSRAPIAHAWVRRPAAHLIRLVLLWFALSIGVAIASPIVHPQAMELVCSSAGAVKAVVHTADGTQDLGAGQMDCPLCVPAGAPPATPPVLVLPALLPPALAPRQIPSAHIAAMTAAPPPARGPPAFS